jgi:glucosamine--fructose-6-phosphate aminotransferase (isomerizing)
MCGIVGYSGPRPVVDFLLSGLQTLEYRGYDSAGVAVFNDGRIQIEKSEGKLSRLVDLVKLDAKNGKRLESSCGMGHTRWAMQGPIRSRSVRWAFAARTARLQSTTLPFSLSL